MWTGPFTKSGKSALVAEGPWIYALDAIAVHAVCEREELEHILPEGLKPTGEIYIYFADIISKSPSFPELNYQAPGLVQYKELAIFTKVKFEGKNYAYCPFMYVDNDVSLLRGYVAGFPKKMAVIDITKQHSMLEMERRGGTAMRSGYGLIKLIVEAREDVGSNPLDSFGSWLLYRISAPMGVREFVEIVPDVEYGHIRKGTGELEIGGGINDELEHLKIMEVVAGYSFSAILKVSELNILKNL